MIDVKTLSPSDVGRKVIYKPAHTENGPASEWEEGVLTSFRVIDGGVFVRFKGPTGEKCNPKHLFWSMG